MSKDIVIERNSTLYERLKTIRMTQAERRAALNALADAELVVDGVVWLVRRVEQLTQRLFLKPSLKH